MDGSRAVESKMPKPQAGWSAGHRALGAQPDREGGRRACRQVALRVAGELPCWGVAGGGAGTRQRGGLRVSRPGWGRRRGAKASRQAALRSPGGLPGWGRGRRTRGVAACGRGCSAGGGGRQGRCGRQGQQAGGAAAGGRAALLGVGGRRSRLAGGAAACGRGCRGSWRPGGPAGDEQAARPTARRSSGWPAARREGRAETTASRRVAAEDRRLGAASGGSLRAARLEAACGVAGRGSGSRRATAGRAGRSGRPRSRRRASGPRRTRRRRQAAGEAEEEEAEEASTPRTPRRTPSWTTRAPGRPPLRRPGLGGASGLGVWDGSLWSCPRP